MYLKLNIICNSNVCLLFNIFSFLVIKVKKSVLCVIQLKHHSSQYIHIQKYFSLPIPQVWY
jgi:hypothetical protein